MQKDTIEVPPDLEEMVRHQIEDTPQPWDRAVESIAAKLLRPSRGAS